MGRPCRDSEARRVALALLAKGLGSPGDIAEFVGVSRQVIEGWARRAGVDWTRMRHAILAREWRKEIRRGARLVKAAAPTTEQYRSARGH